MKDYDLIIIGTGSSMNYLEEIIKRKPGAKIAIIDKDDPGGICLTRGCIPSKLLIYPADLIRTIETAGNFGIDTEIKSINFRKIMETMRSTVSDHINRIRRGLTESPEIDYYKDTAEFTSPYTLKVGSETITSKTIFLCTGSRPYIPQVKGLKDTGYLTSDTLLKLTTLPKSIAIIGGGYIAAEYGHFFSAMGSEVTIIGRNERILPGEEPEISALAKKEYSRHMTIITGHEVIETQKDEATGNKKITAKNTTTGKEITITASEILLATGRAPNTDILHPEKSGIKTDKNSWILVDEYLETTQPGIWAFGDANGNHLFKHVGNYESYLVFHNAYVKKNMKVDYHAVPHAVFSHPEIASVGMLEKEAINKHGEKDILIGFRKYEDTAKGEAIHAKDCFVKIIIDTSYRILGAHIIGPQASVLIHEVINLMYTPDRSAYPIIYGMHIHPSLSEVISKAFESIVPPFHYHHLLGHMNLESG